MSASAFGERGLTLHLNGTGWLSSNRTLVSSRNNTRLYNVLHHFRDLERSEDVCHGQEDRRIRDVHPWADTAPKAECGGVRILLGGLAVGGDEALGGELERILVGLGVVKDEPGEMMSGIVP